MYIENVPYIIIVESSYSNYNFRSGLYIFYWKKDRGKRDGTVEN